MNKYVTNLTLPNGTNVLIKDSECRTNLSNEINRATKKETLLQQNINAEASAREQGDTALQTNIDNEISTLHTMISSPYNFKGEVASLSGLPASGQVNDTYYVKDVKYKVTWTGSAWVQSSLNEADYETELSELNKDLFSSSILVNAMRFDNNVFTENKIILTNGTFRDNPSYLLSEWIPINSANIFVYDHLAVSSSVLSVAYYDSNKNFIRGVQGTGVWQNGETASDITGYVRFSTQSQYLNSANIYIKNLINSRIKSADSNLLNGKNEYYFSKNTKINRYNLTINDIKGDSFGDSITQQYGTDESDTWQGLLKNILGCESIDNHGMGGSTISTIASNGMCTDDRINALTENANFVIVMGGVNDWAQNVPIGDKTYYNTNTNTFFGACNVMFRKLISAQHSRRIIALGCTLAKYPNRYNFDDNRGILNNLGLSSIDYSNAMIESAKLNGIEHYNIGANLCINESNIADYFNDENGAYFIHPNAYGRILIASYIANVIG